MRLEAVLESRSAMYIAATQSGLVKREIRVHWPTVSCPPLLSRSEIHVWAVHIHELSSHLSVSTKWFADEERERARSFRFEPDRCRYVSGRVALRVLLASYVRTTSDAIQLSAGQYGKPEIARRKNAGPPHLEFNLSHSHDIVLLAFAFGCAVGIDVEHLPSALSELSPGYSRSLPFTLRAAPKVAPDLLRPRYRRWVRNEAAAKAAGTGLLHALAGVESRTAEQPGQDFTNAQSGQREMTVGDLSPSPDYAAAIAYTGKRRVVRCFDAARMIAMTVRLAQSSKPAPL